MKVYKAENNIDGMESVFIVYDNGQVSVSPVMFSDEGEVEYVKEWGHTLCREDSDRINDMINPVLLAEW